MTDFNTHGGYFSPKDYFKVETGGSHEENRNGGVQIGVDQQGIPNMLEEGEPVYQDYVYSDNITADEKFLEQFNLPAKYKGKLYSDIADDILSEAEERPLDTISNNGLNAMLIRLANAQETQKQEEQQRELEAELAKLSPEELAELEQMLGEQAAAEQQVAEPQMQVAPEEEVIAEPQPVMMANGGLLRTFDEGTPGSLVQIDNTAVAAPVMEYQPAPGTPYTGEILPDYSRKPILDLRDTGFGRGMQKFAASPIGQVVDFMIPDDATSAFGPIGKVKVTEEMLAKSKRLRELSNEAKNLTTELANAKAIESGKNTSAFSGMSRSSSAVRNAIKENELMQQRVIKEEFGNATKGAAKKTADTVEKTEKVKKPMSKGAKIAAIGGGTAAVGVGGLLANYFINRNAGYKPVKQASTSSKTSVYDDLNAYLEQNDFANGGLVRTFQRGTPGNYSFMPNMMNNYLTPNGGIRFYDPTVLEPAVVTAYTDNFEPEYPKVLVPTPDDYQYGSNYEWRAWGRPEQNIFGGQSKFNQNKEYAPYFWPRVTNGTGSVVGDERHSMFTPSMFGMDDVFSRSFNYALDNNLFGSVKSSVPANEEQPVNYAHVVSGNGSAGSATAPTVAPSGNVKPVAGVSGVQRGIPVNTPVAPLPFNRERYEMEHGITPDFGGIGFTPDPRIAGGASAKNDAVVAANPVVAESNGAEFQPPVLSTAGRNDGLWANLAAGLYNLGHKPYKFNSTLLRPYLPTGQIDLQRMRYNPVDVNQMVNGVDKDTALAIAALRNSGLGPSTAQAILAADARGTEARGQAFQQGRQYNDNLYNAVIAQNNDAAAREAAFDFGVSQAQTQPQNEFALRRGMQDFQSQIYNYQELLNRAQALGQNADAIAEYGALKGSENQAMNMANYNRALYDWIAGNGVMGYKGSGNQAKCGGKILLRKYKK